MQWGTLNETFTVEVSVNELMQYSLVFEQGEPQAFVGTLMVNESLKYHKTIDDLKRATAKSKSKELVVVDPDVQVRPVSKKDSRICLYELMWKMKFLKPSQSFSIVLLFIDNKGCYESVNVKGLTSFDCKILSTDVCTYTRNDKEYRKDDRKVTLTEACRIVFSDAEQKNKQQGVLCTLKSKGLLTESDSSHQQTSSSSISKSKFTSPFDVLK